MKINFLVKIKNYYLNSETFREVSDLTLLSLITTLLLFMVAKPLAGALITYAGIVSEVRNVEENLVNRANRIQEASNKINKLTSFEIDRIKTALPLSPTPLPYIATLEKLAAAYQVNLNIITAKELPLQESNSSLRVPKEVILTTKINGSFAGIQGFLADLKNTTRVSNLGRLILSSSENVLSAEADISVYYLR